MSDGWGSASGIEGNYDDDEEVEETNETNEVTETAEASSSTETKETNSPNKTNRTNKTNIKDEWNGRTIYIPDSILDDMEDTYLESQLKLRKADRDEFKKNRHFYPLLVQFGLEALSNADTDEIQARLSNIGER
ncbi:hypothetical protein C457_11121 [Haloferax prahovense DSM 18310]|uniref:DUF8160 domain-containing protein n=1 Tax=Haloferax prahovense (strain DSM 18310 / JCM 13924 / TL6) TaxID=1227461 RepID=M0G8H1_HALPT|nr:hypothetical protein [Haloferax prahovense]ELZ68551.1 hypothetical protein C457_11121 [Haloferax prahovense DSM 18310]